MLLIIKALAILQFGLFALALYMYWRVRKAAQDMEALRAELESLREEGLKKIAHMDRLIAEISAVHREVAGASFTHEGIIRH